MDADFCKKSVDTFRKNVNVCGTGTADTGSEQVVLTPLEKCDCARHSLNCNNCQQLVWPVNKS